uniref:G_PROTEIN_RECEP_F1_2 domain-containing protein n=1 Tax=Parastrongyloides trichosuri TaxID=131310 RepID=A0A0N4ZGM8_PARTI
MNTEWGVYLIILIYFKLALCGLIGNIWVMYTVTRQLLSHKKYSTATASHYRWISSNTMTQSSASIYLLTLSVVDLISLICVPMLANDILNNMWPYGDVLCKIFYACEGANKSLSPLLLTALSVDRYIAVCRPNLAWLRQTKHSLGVVFICFIISLIFILQVTWKSKVTEMIDYNGKEHLKCTVRMTEAFDVYHAISCYILPLLVILGVYIAILNRLYHHTRYSTVGKKTSINLSRVVRCSVMVVAFYFICWTPYWTLRMHALITGDSGQYGNFNETIEINNGSKHFTHAESALLMNNSLTLGNKELAIKEDIANVIQTTIKTSLDDNITQTNERSVSDFFEIFFLYLLHALPYTQSSFNWLFYAFLNQNLRNPGKRNGSKNVLPNLPNSNIDNQNNPNERCNSVLVAWKNFSTNITSNIFNSPRHKRQDNTNLRHSSINCETFDPSPDICEEIGNNNNCKNNHYCTSNELEVHKPFLKKSSLSILR